jgi:hypothetical protein
MATYTSVQNGNWNDPLTWGSASYPSIAGDIVNIIHEVIYNVDSVVQMGDINIKGNTGILRFSKTMNTRLALQHKNINIGDANSSGKLIIGESDEECLPKEYTAIIEFATTSDNAKGIILTWRWSGQQFSLHGDPNLYGNVMSTVLASNWTSGTTITVVGDLTNKWRIGQKLVLQNTEEYPPSSSPQSSASKLKIVTITDVVLNGLNTNITVSEAWANTFYANANVTNLTRNIIIRKVNALTTIGNWNTSRPILNANLTQAAYNDIEINNVDFTGFYSIKQIYASFKRCVFRNGYYGFYDSAWNVSVTDYDKVIKITEANNVKESIFFSVYYPFSDGGICYNHISDSQFIGNTYCFNNDGNKKITDCKFIANNIVAYSCRQMKFYDCDFMQNAYAVYMSTNMEFYNCMHYKQNRLCNRGGPYLFKDSYHGCDRNEVLEAAFWDRYGESHNLYGSDLTFDGCIGGLWLYPASNSFDILKIRNMKNFDVFVEPDSNGWMTIITDCGAFDENGNGRISENYISKRVLTEHYVGDDSQKIKIKRGESLDVKVVDFILLTENNVKTSLQKRKIFIKTENFIQWTSNNLYLEVEYLNNATSWSTAKIQSTQAPSANNEWTELSVEFTPAREGDAIYRLRLNGFPVIDIQWVYWEEWVWWEAIYVDPFIYIDSAIWVSDTQYVKIPWGVGDWEPRFTKPEMPVELNVRKDIVYDDNQFTGSLIVPSQDDVREGVEVDDAYSVGNLELPIESNVKKNIEYGTEGTEFIGTFEPTYNGQRFEVDLYIE